MSKTISAMFLAIVVIGGTAVLGLSGIATAATSLATDAGEVACDPVAGSPEYLAGEIFFLAQTDKQAGKKYKCLEKCSDTRYDCEKVNKDQDKVGTKKNYEESSKCQVKYADCLDKCE